MHFFFYFDVHALSSMAQFQALKHVRSHDHVFYFEGDLLNIYYKNICTNIESYMCKYRSDRTYVRKLMAKVMIDAILCALY